ncbi:MULTISPECIES: sensor histidine kinase [unclassified Pseudoclavibacter]|uniref:sensor histidine kinase n=1 Tax=unclassified Pseudoclavibacter TaxID=2615177 RepID=UPI001BA6E5EC|nr:ATP-binding protein [Pseudoclavibacter sp. Marseille-Q4354]MBS3177839.1 hypothetical protein [Pseudoclavibacter sp. Marseille-Q4354]
MTDDFPLRDPAATTAHVAESDLTDAIDEVLDAAMALLSERGDAAVEDGDLDPVFRAHVVEILTEAWTRLAGLRDFGYLQAPASLDLGLMQATADVLLAQGLHPAQPLVSANVLFEVALPAFASRMPVPTVTVAQVLHSSVFGRFVPGALAYAETLRGQLSGVQRVAELRLARQLRESILPELGGDRPARAAALVDALSWDLEHPAPQDFPDALFEYASHDLPILTPVEVTEIGTRGRVSAPAAEELHAIAVEAIRNARRHAGASRIDVVLLWRPSTLVLTVTDDGHGAAAPLEELGARTHGIASMRQRAALVHARIRFETNETGTTVTLTCPTDADEDARA